MKKDDTGQSYAAAKVGGDAGDEGRRGRLAMRKWKSLQVSKNIWIWDENPTKVRFWQQPK